jgi:peptide/nickel transport system substrate-binding protein
MDGSGLALMNGPLDFRVLGPIEVAAGDQVVVLPQGKPRTVLGVLLVHANETVSSDQLIDDVWGPRAPVTAAKAIHVYVSQLRRCLGPGVIATRPPGYELQLSDGQLDTQRFEQLRADASHRDPADAAATLRDALALWRGPPYADFTYEPFAQATIARLEELRLSALEERIDADLTLERQAELVPELTTLIRAQPLRERLRGQLMLALYRSGRQADALAAYRDGQQLLDEQLGLEPGPELKQLQHQILSHDPSLNAKDATPVAVSAADVAVEGPSDGGWRRPLRRLAPVAGVVAIAALAAGVLVAREGPGSAQAAGVVSADSVGVFEPQGPKLVAQVPVQTGPGPVAIGADAVWVVNVDANSLSRVDPAANTVVQTIALGSGPSGIAIGGGFVWVVNSGDATLDQIDPKTNTIVQRLPVGSQPSGVAYGDGAVWVANHGDRTVTHIDPATGATKTIPVAIGADGIALGEGAVWVTSAAAGAVSRIDPQTDSVVGTINTGPGADAVAAGAGAVWVANAQAGSVSRIDPTSNQMTATLPVGDGPNGIVISGNNVWVSNELGGTLTRIDAASGQAVQKVRVGNRPEGIARDGQAMYVAVRTAGLQHRGGTLTVAVGSGAWQAAEAPGQLLNVVNDGLTTYRHVGGAAGAQVVPDLAVSLPTPADGGKTYTFHLRPDIRWSTGAVVRPADVRSGIMRTIHGGGVEIRFFSAIRGIGQCRWTVCQLSQGITTDEAAGTITFHLSRPDPDFLYELATPAARAVPVDTPENYSWISEKWAAIPATGPYMFAGSNLGQHMMRLVRNPYYHEWSAAAQPAGYPDTIIARFDRPDAAQLRTVERGGADFYTLADNIGAAAVRTLEVKHASQLHANPTLTTTFFAFNLDAPPFDDVRVRRAVNYAWNRKLAPALEGGRLFIRATCQVLPPNMPGYRRYCPYSVNPQPDGSYTGPNVAQARRLVKAAGTRGQAVTVWGSTGGSVPEARYLTSVLQRLGYKARLKVVTDQELFAAVKIPGRVQVAKFGWGADFPSAFNFFDPNLSCSSGDNLSHFCSSKLDAQVARANTLQVSNPQAASVRWAKIDREIVNRAIWLFDANTANVDVVSPRVHNYQYSPQVGALLDQLWVR